MQVHALPVTAEEFAEQQRPTVPENWCVPTELMTRICHRHRCGPDRHRRPGQDADPVPTSQRCYVQSQRRSQLLVQHEQLRVGRGSTLPRHRQSAEFVGEGALEAGHDGDRACCGFLECGHHTRVVTVRQPIDQP
jgi:hypothetical protein